MSPSLNELGRGDGSDSLADAEDMYGKQLTFNENIPVQAGWKVQVIEVNMKKGTHAVKLQSGVIIEISNTADVYEPLP